MARRCIFTPPSARATPSGFRSTTSERRSKRPRESTAPATTYVAERLAAAPADDTEIEIDFSGTSWEFIFQDIVRRSATLRYVTAVTSFTCSKMRPDGFGGMAVLITADAILGKSTNDILEDFLAENDGRCRR